MTAPGTDLFAPRYLVKVEGTKLQADVTRFISGVEFEEAENISSKITLSVTNQGGRFTDERIFAEGNKVDLWMGYVGKPLHFMDRGIIVRPNPTFPRRGIPMINVVAHGLSRRLMNTGKDDKGKVYKKQRDSEIAEAIFKDIGAAPFVFETKGLKTRVRKRGTTRWQFLQKLARLHNFVVFVKYDAQKKVEVGYFGPPDVEDQPEKHTFIYGTGEPDATLLEFFPNLSIPSQTTKLQVVYTDPKTRKTHRLTVDVEGKKAEKTKFTADAGMDAFSYQKDYGKKQGSLKDSIKNGSAVTLEVFGQQEEVLVGRSFKTQAEAKRWAAGWFRAREDEFAFGRGVLLGSPDVRRGHVHEFQGIGNRLSGDWQLVRARHRMNNSGLYEVSFGVRKVVLDSVVGAPDSTAKVKDKEAES